MVQQKGRHNLKEEERNLVAQWLLQHYKNKKMRHGAFAEAASKFGCHRNTIQSIWKIAHHQQELGGPIHVKSMKGANRAIRKELDKDKVRALSVLDRTSYRGMTEKLQVSKSLIANWYKKKLLKACTSSLKPTLTEENKFNRLQWSLSQLEPTVRDDKFKYKKMKNVVHIDEKWFNLTKQASRYYLLPGEEEPYRTCKSKRFIEKIMFATAVTRPHYSDDGTCIFDGKIGIFPFTTKEPAKRKSKNRDKGTLITKPIESINLPVMKDVMINKIVPNIIQKWPEEASKHIIIQQDNARPHIKPNDPDFIKAANSHGFHIELVNQPANSPDTNVNDLGFFRAIQTLKDRKAARGMDDLLKNVTDAFEEFETYKLNNVFLTLQGCYTEIMKERGGNNYKVPHMNKNKHIREDSLPECLEVDEQIVKDCIAHLNQLANENESIQSIEDLVDAFNVLGMEG